MKQNSLIAIGFAAAMAVTSTAVDAAEFGLPGIMTVPGAAAGGLTAMTPPPGVYMFTGYSGFEARIVGPGAPVVNGAQTFSAYNSLGSGITWVPGWTFWGGKYSAFAYDNAANFDIGSPANVMKRGFHNPLLVPAELSWDLGGSGFFVKTGLGIYVPIGTINGASGTGSIGSPMWTFRPELITTYSKDGWNVTLSAFEEFNTVNYITQYQSGNTVEVDFSAIKKLDKWSLGPVAYWYGQVTNDTSSAFYNHRVNFNRSSAWAAGALVGYDFGPAKFTVWALQGINATASGGTPKNGIDTATNFTGFQLFARLSFKIWSPDEQTAPQHFVMR
jgi:hypothetical protein